MPMQPLLGMPLSRPGTARPLARGWMVLLLPLAIGSLSCENTDPPTNGSTAGLTLVTSTAGIQPDDDGYTIMVDGTAHGSIGPNDSLTVAGVNAGSHAVELSDINFNCATLGQFTRTVAISADAEAMVDYAVACDAVSRSRIALVGAQIGLSPYIEVLLMNADGSDAISLTDSLGAVSPGSRLHPPVSWSADGSRLAFTRSDDGLYATTDDGTGVVKLADSGRSPIMSADGRVPARKPAAGISS